MKTISETVDAIEIECNERNPRIGYTGKVELSRKQVHTFMDNLREEAINSIDLDEAAEFLSAFSRVFTPLYIQRRTKDINKTFLLFTLKDQDNSRKSKGPSNIFLRDKESLRKFWNRIKAAFEKTFPDVQELKFLNSVMVDHKVDQDLLSMAVKASIASKHHVDIIVNDEPSVLR